jgi:hypothetical protein
MSYLNIEKSCVKEGHLNVYAKLEYIDNVNLVCLGNNYDTPQPKKDDIVVFKSFFL